MNRIPDRQIARNANQPWSNYVPVLWLKSDRAYMQMGGEGLKGARV